MDGGELGLPGRGQSWWPEEKPEVCWAGGAVVGGMPWHGEVVQGVAATPTAVGEAQGSPSECLVLGSMVSSQLPLRGAQPGPPSATSHLLLLCSVCRGH